MANANWIANAQARPDVWWGTPDGIEATSWFAITINHKTLKVYAGGKDSSGTATTINAAGIVKLLYEAIQATDIPEWRELAPTMGILYDNGNKIEVVDEDGQTLILTGPADGKPVTITCSSGTGVNPTVLVTETTKGITGRNEQQTVSIPSTISGGTFTLTFSGQTTSAMAFNIAIGDLEDALEALSNIAPGDVAVTGAAPTWVVEFKATYAQTDVPLMTGDGSSLTGGLTITVAEITAGGGAASQEQQWILVPIDSGGSYRFRFIDAAGDSFYTSAFIINLASPDATPIITGTPWQGVGTPPTYYRGLWNFVGSPDNDVGVEAIQNYSGARFNAGFIGAWARENMQPTRLEKYQPYLAAWGDVGTFTTTQEGSAANANEVQRITVPTATGGHFHLTFQGQTTGAITYSATPATLAANIQAALLALSNVGSGNLTAAVYDSNADQIRVDATFIGALAATDVGLISGDGTSLTGAVVSIYTSTTAVQDVNEVQTISLPDVPTGGTFTLSFGGYTTTPLTYDESAADIDTALESLTSIGAGQVVVTGSAGGPWTVTFGGTLAATDVALISGSGYGLVLSGTQVFALSRPVVRKYPSGTWVQTTRVFTTGTNPVNDGVAVGDAAMVFVDAKIGEAAYMSRVTARDSTTITLSADAIEGSAPTDGTNTRTLLIVTAPTGPAFYDDVANWEGGVLPADSDAINAEDGSGSILYHTNQSLITVAAINLKASFTGQAGLGRTDANGYWQYRTQYLTLGNATDAVPTTITVGLGDGDGTGHLWLNSGTGQVAIKVDNTSRSADTDLPAFVWKGTHVSNTMEVLKGTVGVAMFAGDAAALATLAIGYVNSQDRDATVTVGAGCTTITTITKLGGTLNLYTGATTLIQDGGETLHYAGAIGTLTLNGGTYTHQNAGNITTLNIYADAVADFSKGDAAVTITNCTIYGKNAPVDPHKRITFTNPPAYKGGGQLSLDWGTTYSIQRS